MQGGPCKKKRKGRTQWAFIEQVGFYNPNTKVPEIRFDQEKVLYVCAL